MAEEGLDIPECNLVVRYGLLTNEIAQQQASGRARARESQYSVVAQAGGREVRREKMNEYLEDLTGKAIAEVQAMNSHVFRKKVRVHCFAHSHLLISLFIPSSSIILCLQISDLQIQAVIANKFAENLKTEKRSRYAASSVQLLCRNCFKSVALGSNIKLVEKSHYVNISPDFKWAELLVHAKVYSGQSPHKMSLLL